MIPAHLLCQPPEESRYLHSCQGAHCIAEILFTEKKDEHGKNLSFGLQTRMHFMSLNDSSANTLSFYIWSTVHREHYEKQHRT